MAEGNGMAKWFALPVNTVGGWVGLAVSVVVIVAVAMRVPGVKRIFPGR